jgi:hypothetical protein
MLKPISTILIYFLFSSSVFSQQVLYVNEQANGIQSGESWDDAFTNLQDALNTAFSGFEIWVATGTYRPTSGTDRSLSFYLKNGVKVYGGFIGNETERQQRNPELNPVRLSGDIGVLGDPLDNSYHVIQGKGLDSTTVLDGVIVSHGYSYGENLPGLILETGGGLLLEYAPWINTTRPRIEHCIFEYNQANYGGGIGMRGEPSGATNLINPIIRDCIFRYNRAQIQGGAIYKLGPSDPAGFTLENCTITDNYVFAGDGGGVCIVESPNSNYGFYNCVFARDTSLQGGGLHFKGPSVESASFAIEFDSCTFIENYSLEGGGFSFDGYSNYTDSIELNIQIRNSLFEKNITSTGDGPAFFILISQKSQSQADIQGCDFIENKSGGYYISQFGLFRSSYVDINYENNRFIRNGCTQSSGSIEFPIAINCSGETGPVTVNSRVSNCLFQENRGGVLVLIPENCRADHSIVNCTFYENRYPQFVRNNWDTIIGDAYFYYKIRNCVIWETGSNIYNIFYTNDPDNITLYGFDIDYCSISVPNPQGPPGWFQAFGEHMQYRVDPMFADSSAGDFRLLPCSPAVNFGDNDIVEDIGLLQDLLGNERVLYDTVDLGVYEATDSCFVSAVYASNSSKEFSIWNNPSDRDFLIFPNPTPSNRRAEIEVYDLGGELKSRKEIDLSTINEIDIPPVENGIYFIKLVVDEQQWIAKWVRFD